MIGTDPMNGYIRAGVKKETEQDKRFSYGFKVDVVGRYNNSSPLLIQQLNAELKYRSLYLEVGAKEEFSLERNRELSSGSMTWSGNARPIPQVRIGIPHYTTIPHSKGWLHVKAGLSYGWFMDNHYLRSTHGEKRDYAENILYHRKYLMLRIEKDKPFYGSLGVDMAAQFGGTVYEYSTGKEVVHHFPSDLNAFLKVLVPTAGGKDAPGIDQVNISGNHLGTYNLMLGYKHPDKWSLELYHEHYFEDHSGMIFKNGFDGLWGLEFKRENRKWLSGLLVEFLMTKNQSGPFLWDKTSAIPIQVSGGDDYYNNIYPGWTHNGHSIGTPFITSPLYNGNGNLKFTNTRTVAFHLGAKGELTDRLSYRLLCGYQQGWGTPKYPYSSIKHNFSMMLEASYYLNAQQEWYVSGSAGFDRGDLMGNNTGLLLKFGKTGILSR